MKRSPNLESARKKLVQTIADIARTGKTRLPSLRVLASRFRVSERTMWTATRELVQQGVLGSRRGYGYFVKSVPGGETLVDDNATPQAIAGAQAAWERIRDALRTEILDGKHHPGRLFLSVKELCRRYGASFETVKRALAGLETEGLIRRTGRAFRVEGYAPRSSEQRIALIAREFDNEVDGVALTRYLEDLAVLESECQRFNLGLSHVKLGFVEERLVCRSDRDGVLSPSSCPVLGFILWPVSVTEYLEPVWSQLVRTRKPLAVMAPDSGDVPFLASGVGLASCVVRTSRDFDAGRAVGRHLLERGHTRVAFFSMFGMGSWVEPRLAGLRQVFRDAGRPAVVQEYTTTMHPRGLWNESMEGRSPDSKAIMQIARGLERSARTAQGIRQHDIWRELYRVLPGAVQSAANYRAFVPLGEMALADGGHTAFVGANDTAALQCLTFLREKGFSSRQISVIGFDNTNDSAWNNITSFEFGVVAAIHRSIDFILRPLSHKRDMRGVHEVQVQGHIVDRGSVWRVG